MDISNIELEQSIRDKEARKWKQKMQEAVSNWVLVTCLFSGLTGFFFVSALLIYARVNVWLSFGIGGIIGVAFLIPLLVVEVLIYLETRKEVSTSFPL